MICQHFNLSWIEVRDELNLYEYYVLLAEALDAQELDDHRVASLQAIAFHNPKGVKRWKWSSPDKAGTKSTHSSNPFAAMAAFAMQQTGGVLKKMSDPSMYADATGQTLLFVDNKGNHFDRQGKPAFKTGKDEYGRWIWTHGDPPQETIDVFVLPMANYSLTPN
jgi:hypothetical protein